MKQHSFLAGLGLILVLVLTTRTWAQDAVTDALTDLNGLDANKQLLAVLNLSTMNDPRIVPALITKAQNRQAPLSVRSECLKQLTERKAADALPVMLQVAQTPEEPPAVRSPAMIGLTMLGGSKYTDEFIKLVRQDKSPLVRRQACMCLGQLGSTDPKVVEKILPLLDDVNTAPYAIASLATAGDTAAVPKLIQQLSSDNQVIRLSVIRALADLKDKRAVDPLIQLLDKGDDYQRVTVLAALGQLQDKRAVAPLAAVAKNTTARDVLRQRALLSLADLAAPEALPTVSALATSPTEKTPLRIVAVQALGRFGDPAIPILLQCLSEKALGTNAALSLSTITGTYIEPDKDKWTKYCTQYLENKKQQRNP